MMKAAQTQWAETPVRARLAIVRRVRFVLAERAAELTKQIDRNASETLTAEVLPLLEACRFLEENAAALLAENRPHGRRPSWLRGVDLVVRREPLGVVLVIGPGNYPLFLPAVHTLQALVAGNAVILKPGRGGSAVLAEFVSALHHAGLDSRLVRLLGEEPEEARRAIDAGVDKVVLTGSFDTGRAVLEQLAATATPAVMELSGDDVVFVRPGADMDLVRRAVRFGMTLNGGDTCIAPKLIVAWPETASELRNLGLPVEVVTDDEQATAAASRSGHGLGASVFGPDGDCMAFARKLRVGTVVINDMIVPTADPRLPFGGRGRSGFGVTRGAEGLLEMTSVKAVALRRGRWLPHLDGARASDAELFTALIGMLHGGALRRRASSLGALVRCAVRRWRMDARSKEKATV